MSTHPLANMDANTALGRSAIAVATCGDSEETGCDLCGYVVAARDPRAQVLKNMCKLFVLYGSRFALMHISG